MPTRESRIQVDYQIEVEAEGWLPAGDGDVDILVSRHLVPLSVCKSGSSGPVSNVWLRQKSREGNNKTKQTATAGRAVPAGKTSGTAAVKGNTTGLANPIRKLCAGLASLFSTAMMTTAQVAPMVGMTSFCILVKVAARSLPSVRQICHTQ